MLGADERAPGRLRGGAPRRRHPVPGLVAARARRGASAAQAARPRRPPPGSRARVRELAPTRGCSALPDKLGERELTRQADLARLVALAQRARRRRAHRRRVRGRAAAPLRPGGRGARGVHLLTYHRAKGLEFDAVFLPRLDEKELPSKLARTADELAEERRLLYVGITRARRYLAVTWSKRPSPFLAELGHACGAGAAAAARRGRRGRRSRSGTRCSTRRSRRGARRARSSDEIPPYIVFHNTRPGRDRRRAARGRSQELAQSRASARRSSTATATRC